MKYRDGRSQRTRSALLWFAGGGIAVAIVAVAFWLVFLAAPRDPEVKSAAKPKPELITSRLLIVGDVFWGRSVQRKAESSGKGPAYLMSGLDPEDRAGYDAWIGNFECPVTYRDIPYAQQMDSLKFNCRPEYLPELAKWFTAVSLANNHTDNNGGPTGLLETRQNLEKAGIQHFGNYDMAQTADICEVTSLPAKVKETKQTRSIPVAFCGYHQVVNIQPTDAQLAVMQEYSRVMPVIAMPHMGVEYRPTGEPEKVKAYRNMIDNGASAVIAAHPHVIQNSELHRGKLIMHSLGNFLFDQQSLGKETSVGLGLEVNLEISNTTNYAKVGQNCVGYKDDCLQQLIGSNAPRPNVTVTYDYRCFDMTRGVPTPGSAAICDEAKQKATISNLKLASKQL